MAYKGLAMVTRLSGGARQVAGALLDRYNRRTGQCDPSVETLMGETGIARSTVNAALDDLCDDPEDGDTGKLFGRIPHGGFSHRTSYHPRWHAFERAIEEHAKRKEDMSKVRKTGRSRTLATVRKTGPSGGEASDPETVRFSKLTQSGFPNFDSTENRTQTLLRNPLKKPMGVSTSRLEAVDNPADGLSKGDEGPAYQAAHRRLNDAVNALEDVATKKALFMVPEPVWKAATRAGKGKGLAMLAEAAGVEVRR